MGTSANRRPKKVSKKDFNYLQIIGKGGFSDVWLARHKDQDQVYAIKEMEKVNIVRDNYVKEMMIERNILVSLKHPFVVNLIYAFQDADYISLVLEFLTGGDLRFHINKLGKFTESQTKFIVCCMIISIEYLHSFGIIHKDIKPENYIFDSQGYLRITDFGTAVKIAEMNFKDSTGSPPYMAPEALLSQEYSFPADYYSIGVIAYECMKGRRPYQGMRKEELIKNMNLGQVTLKKHDLPEGWTIEAADFINKLIEIKPEERLGFAGISQIKKHEWLSNVAWGKIFEKAVVSPIDIVENTFRYQRKKTQRSKSEFFVRKEMFLGYEYEGKPEEKVV